MLGSIAGILLVVLGGTALLAGSKCPGEASLTCTDSGCACKYTFSYTSDTRNQTACNSCDTFCSDQGLTEASSTGRQTEHLPLRLTEENGTVNVEAQTAYCYCYCNTKEKN